MKLNRPWTGPWRIIKRLGEVVYRIKDEGSERVGTKRRVVHHNQIRRFHETNNRQKMKDDVDENDDGSTEKDGAAIVLSR